MNQEIKDKLEQAAETATEQIYPRGKSVHRNTAHYQGFEAGAQTILENPIEWGLCSLEIHKQAVKTFDKITTDAINAERATVDERNQLQSQLTKYREALEWYSNIENYLEGDRPMISKFGVNADITSIAKEALKQED